VSSTLLTREELAAAIRETAVLEGDFVLRSGRRSRYYLDKYRLGTNPMLLSALGAALAQAAAELEPAAERLAAPELGAVSLAAAAALSGGLPFVIVRKQAKSYGTANRIEGSYQHGERVCLVEDVVTSGGAALEAIAALRAERLVVESAVCVLDRDEGGAQALAEAGVRLRALYHAQDVWPAPAAAHG
jgi:orotate phosphoribosyltransferase